MGLGRQGFRILELLLERDFGPVDVFDIRPEALENSARLFGNRIRILDANPFSLGEENRKKLLGGYSLVMDALPSFQSYQLMLSVIQAGSRLVSVSRNLPSTMHKAECVRARK